MYFSKQVKTKIEKLISCKNESFFTADFFVKKTKKQKIIKKRDFVAFFLQFFRLLADIVRGLTAKHKERSVHLKKELTSKEKLFCTYYCLGRNAREAAAKSGYHFAEKTAAKLLKRKEILAYIKKNDKSNIKSTADVSAGYYRLAFGCVSDAIGLLFLEDFSKESIEKMDLFNVSEIKRQKGGAIEVKFFDRLKALEKLSEISTKDEKAAVSIYSAIEKSADALRENCNE